MSTHDIGLKDMVSSLQLMGKAPEIFLFVVSIASVQDQGIELTNAAEEKVPLIIENINSLIENLLLERKVKPSLLN